MADLDAVHLGLDENEADIAEELQDFDDSFDTRSEASESGSDSSDSQPSISSVSTAPSSICEKRKAKSKSKPSKDTEKKVPTKRTASPTEELGINGKSLLKKKRTLETGKKAVDTGASTTTAEEKKSNVKSGKNLRKKNGASAGSVSSNGTSTAATNAAANVSSNKSDVSDTDDKPAPKFDSDSESEDSDSAANIKRNGRKALSKSATPEKKVPTSVVSSKSAANKSYDYMTKLNYLFRDTRFFLIKSNNADNIALSKSKNVWATLPQNDANLSQAFKESRNVLLIFSVNESGKFAGFARMSAPSRRDIPQVAWVLPPSISSKALGGVIEIDWICRKELSFNCTSHLYNGWNDGKPVKIGRDGQEIEPKIGAELCRLFPEDEKVELTPILRKSKETAKMMREKGIRMVYKPPRSTPFRGGRGGSTGYRPSDRRGGSGGGGDAGGPMRHKRSYGGPPHRPYKMPPHMGPPGFKRASSPYRGGGGHGGPGGSSSRAGGGDSGLPPWERYMTSAAAAEAYVADYMRTMHGQLPPLPFVPPFAQIPHSASSSGGGLPPSGPPSIYEQLPPPVRYYDGPPPLPDYPPPQPICPPPPGFDKAPSYEDFAAWKNAGLPTVPGTIAAGFPGFDNSSSSASKGGGIGSSLAGSGGFSGRSNAAGGGIISSGPAAYRNRDNNNSNSNRSRERRDRHFRTGGNERGGHRNYRDGRR